MPKIQSKLDNKIIECSFLKMLMELKAIGSKPS